MRKFLVFVVALLALLTIACGSSGSNTPGVGPSTSAGTLAVTLSGNGQSVSGAMVALSGQQSLQQQTDALGKTTFQNLPFGTYTLAVNGVFGFQDMTQNVQLQQAQVSTTLPLTPKNQIQTSNETPACGSSALYGFTGGPKLSIHYSLAGQVSGAVQIWSYPSTDGVNHVGSVSVTSPQGSSFSGFTQNSLSMFPEDGSEFSFIINHMATVAPGGKEGTLLASEVLPCHYTFK